MAENPNNKIRAWYVYKGPSFAIELPGSYVLATTPPACLNGNQLCAIYALAGLSTPQVISNNLQEYISNALISFVSQPTSPLGSRSFVVLKGNT